MLLQLIGVKKGKKQKGGEAGCGGLENCSA